MWTDVVEDLPVALGLGREDSPGFRGPRMGRCRRADNDATERSGARDSFRLRHLLSDPASDTVTAARPASSLAMGTRNGEQET